MKNWEKLRITVVGGATVTPIPKGECDSIRDQHAGIPDDYLSFLTEIGWGELETLQLFSGPVPASEIYGSKDQLSHVILIGDDYQGYCFGYETVPVFALVEVSPSGDLRNLDKSFFDFMEARSTPSS